MTVERTVTVVPEAGLHARPAAKFVEAVNEHESTVKLGRTDEDDDLTPAGSMIAVTSLGVKSGEAVRIVVDGPDEEATAEAVERVLTTPEDELADTNV